MGREAVIVSGVRTAIGNFGGSLINIPVMKLGSIVIRESLKRIGLRPKSSKELKRYEPDRLKIDGLIDLEKNYYNWDDSLREVQVDEVIMGNVLQGGQGQNTARQAAIFGGIPKECTAFTVNKICASGLKAITLGAQSIRLGEADVIVAGGMENMSYAPYVLPKARWGYRMNLNAKAEAIDLMVLDGLFEIFYGYHMGMTAENLSKLYNISRREQDELGAESNHRALNAIKNGVFKEEIVPIELPQRRGPPKIFDTDEHPRETSVELMSKLSPVFKKDGTITAGNASGITDASAAVVLMSRDKAEEMGIEPLVTIKSYASGGIDPAYMGVGLVPAVRKVLHKEGLAIQDLDVIEINEAFAAQTIAVLKELKLPMYGEGISEEGGEIINPCGSGISLGHPIGCTGARITVSIIHNMVKNNLGKGLITMCIGGGQGMAMIVER